MTYTIKGELEIDSFSGAIYFHDENGRSRFRMKGLPRPIPNPLDEGRSNGGLLDVGVDPVTHEIRTSWLDLSSERPRKDDSEEETPNRLAARG